MKWLTVLLFFITVTSSARSIFVTRYGSDIGTGAQDNPYGTLEYACSKVRDGDILFITSDMTGSIYLADKINVTVKGYNGVSNISSGTKYGLVTDNCLGITVSDLAFFGVKGDAYQDGIGIWFSGEVEGGDVTISNVFVSGYGGRGIGVYNYQDKEIFNINILNSTVRDCKWDGIHTGNGRYSKILHNINGVSVIGCAAQDNPGGAVNYSHTGSGIFISCAKNAVIRGCEAAYNGVNNISGSGGPVGIWFGDVENGLIINCVSHENTSNLKDGGGFDVDGGCINIVIDSCESYGNKGAGYMVWEWATESGFRIKNVLIKNSKSTNDGINSLEYGSILIGSTYGSSITDVTFTDLTIRQDQGYVVRSNGTFYNVSICGNEICYNLPAKFSNFSTAPAGVTINTNTFPCVLLSLDTSSAVRPLPGFPSSYYLLTYPSPAKTDVNVVMNAPRGRYRLEIYSAFGQLMDKWPMLITGRKAIKVSLRKYGSGLYYILLVDEYGIESKSKFLKID